LAGCGGFENFMMGGRKASGHGCGSRWLSSAPERALCLSSDAEHLMGLLVA